MKHQILRTLYIYYSLLFRDFMCPCYVALYMQSVLRARLAQSTSRERESVCRVVLENLVLYAMQITHTANNFANSR